MWRTGGLKNAFPNGDHFDLPRLPVPFCQVILCMPIPVNVQRRVAHIDVLIDNAFTESVTYWRLPADAEKRWSRVQSQCQPILIGEDDAILVDCDSQALISAPNGGIVHINGDLECGLETGGYHEVVIRGNVSSNATIRVDGYPHVYIGGSCSGRIESKDGLRIWVDGDFSGSIATGNPVTQLHVKGDLTGNIEPFDEAALLYLCVEGFCASELINCISSIGYTEFNASIGVSDVDAGIYPATTRQQQVDSGNGIGRWCILSRHKRAEP